MATIVNDRDILLESVATRSVPFTIAASNVTGLGALAGKNVASYTDFASSITPVGLVTSLPTVAGYVGPQVVYNTTDAKLYRLSGGAWVSNSAVQSTDIIGQIADAQLAAIGAGKITGALSDSQLSSISASKVAGQLSDAQINAIAAPKVTGTIVTAQIAAAAITSSLIGPAAVGTSNIAANAITAQQIAASTITGAQIAAGTIQADKLLIGGRNLIVNPAPIFNTIAAYVLRKPPGRLPTTIGASPSNYVPDGTGGVYISLSGTPTLNESYDILANYGRIDNSGFKVTAGKFYEVSVYLSLITCNGRISIEWFDTNAISLGVSVSATLPANTAQGSLSNWPRAGGIFAAPSNAVFAQVYASLLGNGVSVSPTMCCSLWFFGEALPNQTILSPWLGSTGVAIDGSGITAQSITAAKILASTITANEIATGTIVAANIAANAITTAAISAGAVTATKIAASSITAGQLAAGAITTSKLAIPGGNGANLGADPYFNDFNASWDYYAGIVTASGASGSAPASTYISASSPSSAIASVALPIDPNRTYRLSAHVYSPSGDRVFYLLVDFFDGNGTHVGTAWGGTYSGYPVAGVIPTPGDWRFYSGIFGAGQNNTIPNNVKTCKIGCILLYAGTVGTSMNLTGLRLEEVYPSTLIQDGSITTAKIVANAITTNQLAAGAVTAANIAANTITAGQIAAGAISATQIAAGAITGDRIAGNTITGNLIAANTIQADKLLIGGRNMLPNAGPMPGTTWGYTISEEANVASAGINASYDPWRPEGGGGVYTYLPGTPAANNSLRINANYGLNNIAVTAGKTYELSVYLSIHRFAYGACRIAFYNSSGAYITEYEGTRVTVASNGALSNWARSTLLITAPAGASTALAFCRAYTDGVGSNTYMFCSNWYFGETIPGQTVPSPWSASASTLIDGAGIRTNSLDASKIVAGTITTDRLVVTSVASSVAASTGSFAMSNNAVPISVVMNNNGTGRVLMYLNGYVFLPAGNGFPVVNVRMNYNGNPINGYYDYQFSDQSDQTSSRNIPICVVVSIAPSAGNNTYSFTMNAQYNSGGVAIIPGGTSFTGTLIVFEVKV